jgi:hypothetical protein
MNTGEIKMSFTKTISVFAALASIFGAGAAGWKLSQDSQTPEQPNVYEQRIDELEKKLEETKKQSVPVTIATPVALPQPTIPQQVQLPPPSPPPVPETPAEQ